MSSTRLLCKLRRREATSALFAAKSNRWERIPHGSDSHQSSNKKTGEVTPMGVTSPVLAEMEGVEPSRELPRLKL